MTDSAMLAKLDVLPADTKARALAMLQNARTWAGEPQTVDVERDAGGWHVSLRFEYGAVDFWSPPAR